MRTIVSKNFKALIIFCVLLCVFNAYGISILFGSGSDVTSLYFLDVGQGDSELIVFSTGARVLIDGGPANGASAREMGSLFSSWSRGIDVVILTHPEEDHFGGLRDLYDRVPVRVLLWSGIEKESVGFGDFYEKTANKNIPEFHIAKGDVIRHGDARIRILWPEKDSAQEKAPTNDLGIVALLEVDGVSAVFTGDVGSGVEKKIAREIGDINILKIAHHGSKYSSTKEFLRILRPELSFIEVGKNSYGHPTDEVLKRISDVGSRIFRTDKDGTVKVEIFDGSASVYSFR